MTKKSGSNFVFYVKCFILDRRYMIQMSVLWTDLLKAEMQIYGRLNIKGLYACSALIWKCWKVFLRPNFSHFRSHCAVNISALLNTSAAKNPNLFGANWQTCEGCWSWNCWHICCCENIFAAVKMWHLNFWNIANVIADHTLTREICLGYFWPLSQIEAIVRDK